MQAPKVLLVEHEESLGHLFQDALNDDGVQAELLVSPQDLVAEVRARQPALLVLDLLPPAEEALATLDALRTDDVTRSVPIVVLTTVDRVFHEGQSSYNVREILRKPFELDRFISVVREEASIPTMLGKVAVERPSGEDFRGYAEHVLAHRSRQIIFRWMQRIRMLSPWRERNLETEELIDYAPRILKLIDVRLHYASHQAFYDRHPEALTRASAHARMRMSQDIGVVPATAEYVMLREEIWHEFRSHDGVVDLDSFLDVEHAINGTMDAVIVATMTAYLRGATGA